MFDRRIADLARAQAIAFFPLDLDPGGAAVALDRLPVSRLERGLPGQAETITIIANVHPLLFFKLRFNSFIKPPEYFARVYNRSFATLGRRRFTNEIETQRKRQ